MAHPDVSVQPVSGADRSVLERLWLMFRHDLSEFRGALPEPDGTFRRDRLEAGLQDPGWAAYLFWSGDRPVGLSLVRAIDEPVRVLNAFFVVRGLRRAGVGTGACRAVLSRHPGRWTVACQDDNPTAVRFWRGLATAVAGRDWTEERRPVPGQPGVPPDVWISFSTP